MFRYNPPALCATPLDRGDERFPILSQKSNHFLPDSLLNERLVHISTTLSTYGAGFSTRSLSIVWFLAFGADWGQNVGVFRFCNDYFLARFAQRMHDFLLGNLCFFLKKTYTNESFFAILNLNYARPIDRLSRAFSLSIFGGSPCKQ